MSEPGAKAQLVLVKAHVEPSLSDRIAALAKRNQRSVAAELRVAITEHLLNQGG